MNMTPDHEHLQEQLSKLVDDYVTPENYKTILAKAFSAHMSSDAYATMAGFEQNAEKTCIAFHRILDFFDYLNQKKA